MKRFIPRAQWIWRQRSLGTPLFSRDSARVHDEENRFIYFRRSFFIDERYPCPLSVSADGRFKLFVNGHFVLFGPGRCSPEYQAVENVDIAPWLTEGKNVIAALVHSYGRNTSWYILPGWEQQRAFGCGGFFLQGPNSPEWQGPGLDTGAAWQYLEANAWQRVSTFSSLGFSEIYDASRAPVGWDQPNFDDADWNAAEILQVPGRNFGADIVPFPYMVSYPRKALQYISIYGQNLRTLKGASLSMKTDPVTMLEEETFYNGSAPNIEGPEKILLPEGATSVQTAMDESCTIVIDFKQIISGRPGFTLNAPKETIIDFTVSDRLNPDGTVRLSDGIPGIDHKVVHRYICKPGLQSWRSFELMGFRYLQLTIRCAHSPLIINDISVLQSNYPLEPIGNFECADPILNRIYRAGARTVKSCMSDSYVDCPTREQRQWVGDAYIQPLISYSIFGETGLERTFLIQAAHTQQENGLLMPVAGGDFSVDRFFNIPGFPLYWIMALDAYLRYTSRDDLMEDFFPVIQRILGWFEKYVSGKGLLENLPHWIFIDWADVDKRGAVTVCNAQYAHCLQLSADLARGLGYINLAEKYTKRALQISAAINRLLWDNERQVYADCLINGKRSRRISQHSNAAMIAFKFAPGKYRPAILNYITDPDRVRLTSIGSMGTVSDGAFDEEKHVVRAQPFYAHFLHRALAVEGRYRQLNDHIRRYWSAMADSDYGTFYEMWQVEPMTSFCHGFSATPSYDLSRYILGIYPDHDKKGLYIIEPHRGGLNWARGSFPTPEGAIRVDWTLDARLFTLNLKLPGATQARLCLPKFKTAATVNTCNGAHIRERRQSLNAGTYRFNIQLIQTEF